MKWNEMVPGQKDCKWYNIMENEKREYKNHKTVNFQSAAIKSGEVQGFRFVYSNWMPPDASSAVSYSCLFVKEWQTVLKKIEKR